MEQPKLTEISQLGEFGLIDRLTKDLPHHNPSTVRSVGDDAAVLRYPGDVDELVTTDLLVESWSRWQYHRVSLSSTSKSFTPEYVWRVTYTGLILSEGIQLPHDQVLSSR